MNTDIACDVVILCGGLGTRLRPTIGQHQKTMAMVNGRPFLDHLVEKIINAGMRRIIFCVGYQAEEIEAYYGACQKRGVSFVFSREHEPLGTAGAIRNAHPHIMSDPCIVVNGDSFCPVDLGALLAFHQKKEASATIVVSSQEQRCQHGFLALDSAARIVSFTEKAQGCLGYVTAGVYVLSAAVFDAFPPQKKCSLEHDVFPRLAGSTVFGFAVAGGFFDIGTPESYARAVSGGGIVFG